MGLMEIVGLILLGGIFSFLVYTFVDYVWGDDDDDDFNDYCF